LIATTMNTLRYTTYPSFDHTGELRARLRANAGPLAAIALAHVLVFYMFYSGLLSRMVQVAMPAAVMVSFVPEPSAPAKAAAPKVVEMAKLTPPPLPVVPLVAIVPPETISIAVQPPTVQAAPAAPAAPSAERAPQVASAVAAPAAPSAPRTLTTGVEYIVAPQVVYPQVSRRMGEQGKVMLRILVSAKGMPDQVTIEASSGSSRLDDAARIAGLRAQFKPYVENGHAVAVYVIVPLNFTLAG
jgi:protein TonB